jgi:hypothetical protein
MSAMHGIEMHAMRTKDIDEHLDDAHVQRSSSDVVCSRM